MGPVNEMCALQGLLVFAGLVVRFIAGPALLTLGQHEYSVGFMFLSHITSTGVTVDDYNHKALPLLSK